MKRKSLILICLCALGLLTWEAQADNLKTTPINNNYVVNNMPIGYEEVILHGDLATFAGPDGIEAGASDEDVYIQFNQNLGNVSISIYDALNNLIYHSNVNTAVQSIFIIPINNPVEGTFILELNSINGDADGGFEHNNN